MTTGGRRTADHHHPEYWTETDHNRFEDRVAHELRDMRADLKSMGTRMAYAMGALAILVFLVNIAAFVFLPVFLRAQGYN